MNTATREETQFIQKIIFIFIIPLIIFGFAKMHVSRKCEAMTEKITAIEKGVSLYVAKTGALPSLDQVLRNEKVLNQMKEHYGEVSAYAAVDAIQPPGTVIEKGVYFKKQLYLVRKKLQNEALQNNILMPDTLGFGDALPADLDVPLLLRKLETLHTVVSAAIVNGVDAITVIKLLEDVEYADHDGKKMPFVEIQMRIDLNCKKETLVKIVHMIGSVKPIIIVKDINVKVLKKDLIEVNLIFSQLVKQ